MYILRSGSNWNTGAQYVSSRLHRILISKTEKCPRRDGFCVSKKESFRKMLGYAAPPGKNDRYIDCIGDSTSHGEIQAHTHTIAIGIGKKNLSRTRISDSHGPVAYLNSGVARTMIGKNHTAILNHV
jgi:hypothetical protein